MPKKFDGAEVTFFYCPLSKVPAYNKKIILPYRSEHVTYIICDRLRVCCCHIDVRLCITYKDEMY